MIVRNKTLVVRADASEQIGMGHIMRCLALSQAWQESGGKVTFACAEVLPAVEERLHKERCELVALGADVSSAQDVKRSAEIAQERGAEWVIVDGYRFAVDYYKCLRERSVRLLTMDDGGHARDCCADVILNPSALANEAMYVSKARHTKLLLGSRYFLLRPEFTRARRHTCQTKMATRILVTMGGSDPENVTLKVVRGLSGIANEQTEVRVVVGAGYRYLKPLKAAADGMTGKFLVVENPGDMALQMAWADMAVAGAGGTCWELAYIGVPAVLMVISQDQLANAEAAAKHGVAVNLGWHSDVSLDAIQHAVRTLAVDQECRRAMSRAGQELIDGLGAKRVVDFLQGAA
jgi:UDP-2,4-diacetamido-2,4,6-trideoxy-beta-L-altropyranose hydrolase